MKFLVIDDSATMRRIVVNSLQRIGLTDIVEAASGLEALEAYDRSCGFVIADSDMPSMSGVEFVVALRSLPDGASVPVLMVTTRRGRQDIPAAVDAGVSDHIIKPFTPQMLKEKIEHLVRARAA